MMNIISSVASAIMSALRTIAGAACTAISVPFRLAGGLFGGGGSAASASAALEQQAAENGAAEAAQRQAAADRDAELVEQAELLRQVAAAIARGRTPARTTVDALSPACLRYVSGLSRESAQAVADTSVGRLKCHLKGSLPAKNLPAFKSGAGMDDTRAVAPVPAPAPAQDDRALRREEVRNALRARRVATPAYA